jgi:hypothetical protein
LQSIRYANAGSWISRTFAVVHINQVDGSAGSFDKRIDNLSLLSLFPFLLMTGNANPLAQLCHRNGTTVTT